MSEFHDDVEIDRAGPPNHLRAGEPEPAALDDVDRALLRHLAADARITNAALAESVGIAPSTCLARVRSLRERGVVRGYHADVDPAAVGLPLQAMISVRLQSDARDRLGEFLGLVRRLPAVRDVYFVAGEDDYLLHVATAGTVGLRDLVATLNGHRDVAGTVTSLIFEHIRPAHGV
ncbi:Lrp/AsnC family transcriptional regulator [Actinomycetospora endophytica]|uniref:Lrp/AsnC family transcriptional regulator n=1 Tax=Actinomycetospora endophytica TaxID=2291215 RepID=A0ABS8P1U5_9PSEU|nr:Lrp/AsnC family transcriptional regulator [Actinomycetospora endophytica]MCD2192218.1 Lrp/AsnC family transcriptional regulator [Actinomycetospora endophytica]